MSALLNALLESSQRDYQNNPWIGGGMGLAQQDFSGYNLSPIQTVLMQAVEHPQFQEVRNIVYFLKRDLLMLSRRLGFYDLELP